MTYSYKPDGLPQHRTPSFADRLDLGSNNFDLLRLVFAIIVVFCHCFTLKGSASDPLSDLLNYGYGGSLAVYGFLVISGFLVTKSVLERSIDEYVLARVVRIVPGLALVTVVEVFVIGLAYTPDTTWTFLSMVGLRHLRNIAVFGLDSQLYGVFAFTDPPWLMNGSLWTIPVECSFYILLLLLFLTTGLRRVVAPVFVLALAAKPLAVHFGLAADLKGPALLANVHLFHAVDLASYFFAGSLAWMARRRVPYSLGLLAVCVIGLYAAVGGVLNDLALKLFLPYLVLYASMAGGMGTRLKRAVGDLSYGTYLFGYPVMLAVIASAGGLSIYQTVLVTVVITLGCAWVSWHLVERPCLRLKTPRRALTTGVRE